MPKRNFGIPTASSRELEREPLYDVRIWNDQGDVERVFWAVSAEEVETIRDQYGDRPHLTVVAEECR